jgi:hypothetical protein
MYKIILTALAALTVTALAGCVTVESASQESLLMSAGFQARTPSTEKEKAAYAALPAYELHRGTKAGKNIYAYKDEKAGVVYIGNEAQYQQYKPAATEAKLRTFERQLRHQQIAQALDQQQISNQLNSIELSQKLMAIRQMQPPAPMPQFYRPVYTQAPPLMMPTPLWR